MTLASPFLFNIYMTSLFDRLDRALNSGIITVDELEMLKQGIVSLAQENSDVVGTDGRDLVLHARDACDAAGIDLDEGEDAEDDE